ncbi:class I SAM-dependent methyltransferase [Paucibacter sp. APW11]|uniref:Class I SAM-dependent methyltransferase n=1 Tax=Roseateles aquae TaxID=3077235 RepID=A0ABU3PH00_9BURK|nr:class I SAM-dependent methyltransferase [Paucibacter sp. APW11]MDT9001851.1 class I SAM-dependent methyltransferase [Paucibacter sp. APW11]
MTDFHGEGPGAQARDGCSVELYQRSSYRGELEGLLRWLKPGATVLELGCGTGRLSRRLAQLGCVVVAVDNSAEMLAQLDALALPGVRSCLADIEGLALDQRFDVVLLASGLINQVDAALRQALVAAAARHLTPHSVLLLERQDAAWLRSAEPGPLGELDGMALTLETVRRHDDGSVAMTLAYRAADQLWRHSFRLLPLAEAEVQALLSPHGLSRVEWLEPGRRWAVAQRPVR